MTMTKKQFYDLAGVPIREIFKILAEEQGKTPDLDEMAARCKEIADELMAQGPEMIHPVVAIARDAKAKGVPVAVASSGVKPTVTGRAAYGGREGRVGGRGASSSLFFRLYTGFVSRCSIPSWSEFNNSSLQECCGSGVTHWQWKKTDSVLCESPTLNEDENHRHRTPSAAAPVDLPPHNSIHYQKLTRCPLPQPRGLRRREREAPAPAHGNDVWRVSAKKK